MPLMDRPLLRAENVGMARPLWSGAISFGLVSIPVKLFPVTQDRGVHFHMVTPDGSCRLRRKLYCPETGKEYDFSESARGYEIAPDEYIVVDPEELEALQPEKGEEIELRNFVKLEELDPILYRNAYYLLPDKKGEKPYRLLVEALRESERVGIGEFVMREKEYLACVRPYEDMLCLETLYYADEMRAVEEMSELPKAAKVNAKELALAKQLIGALTETFEHKQYKDEYRAELEQYLKKRAKTKKPVKIRRAPAPRRSSAALVDLTAKLKKSLAMKKGRRGSHPHAA